MMWGNVARHWRGTGGGHGSMADSIGDDRAGYRIRVGEQTTSTACVS
jgi:hypothetical protein